MVPNTPTEKRGLDQYRRLDSSEVGDRNWMERLDVGSKMVAKVVEDRSQT
jgi:hypothetical protein